MAAVNSRALVVVSGIAFFCSGGWFFFFSWSVGCYSCLVNSKRFPFVFARSNVKTCVHSLVVIIGFPVSLAFSFLGMFMSDQR